MAENEHQSGEYWLIDIVDQGKKFEDVLDPAPDCFKLLDPAPDCCIYKVPQYLRKINEEAYTPCLISIGPLHYARVELMGMENQKKIYWSKFGERVNAQILEEMKNYVKNQEKHIRDHYSVESKLRSSEYVAMILHDAVFIIELFLRKYRHTNDFLLKPPLNTKIALDLKLLENQLPYFVLNDLFMKAFPNQLNLSFFDLQCSFFGVPRPSSKQLQIKHFTDFHRRILVMGVQTTMQSNGNPLRNVPNAIKLKESGLEFREFKERNCILDIRFGKSNYKPVKWLPWFEANELQIPQIKIYDETECKLRNLMALEMFHYPTETHICNYVDLMDSLINTANDVDLLVEKKIIVNCTGDIEAIANMFNRLCTHVLLSEPSYYYDTAKKIDDHYKIRWNHWKATLKSVYFNNLWTGTATVAAAFLLILTLAQTVFSAIQL